MNIEKEIKKIKHGGVKSLVKKAYEKKIDIKFYPGEHPLIRMKHGEREVFFLRGSMPFRSWMGSLTKNKDLTKKVLREVGLKTPNGIVSKSFSEALRFIKKNKLSFPLIIKPLDDSLARGVTWNINSVKEIKKAIETLETSKHFRKSKRFIVEEMFTGDEFRILVFNKKVISCIKKIPATIVGDGNSSIRELIEKFNKTRSKGFEIKIDKVAKKTLEENRLNMNSILEKGFSLKLRNNLNMSDGGRCIEFTDEMDAKFKNICERAIEALGLTYGGIDLMAKDISSPDGQYVILEVNPKPYYNMHEKPLVEGKGIDVSSMILEYLFPRLK